VGEHQQRRGAGRARAEIRKSGASTCELNKNHPQAAELFNPDKLPAFTIPLPAVVQLPLEAQRLGLEAYASDLNPVAVLINKAMIELPPRFANRPPVAPVPKGAKQLRTTEEEWTGARGLAEDVRRYGAWMREEAAKRIGHYYPKVTVTKAMATERPDLLPLVGKELTVIAWLWARTVPSPNPAFAKCEVPLISTYLLSTKVGRAAWVQPEVSGDRVVFHVRVGKSAPAHAAAGTKAEGRGANFKCLLSDTPISGDYIKVMGQQGQMHEQLMALVLDGPKGRIYLSPSAEQEQLARSVKVERSKMGPVPARLTGGTCYIYGLTDWNHLFTDRQLLALNTFSELVGEAVKKAEADALAAGWPKDGEGLEQGGTGAKAYAEAVGVYLGIALSRLSDICNALCRWEVTKTQVRNLFGRQAIPMIWDFAENNVFADAAGDYGVSLSNLVKALERLPGSGSGEVKMLDAQRQDLSAMKLISTDPPYYDNIAYADLSDFFYVWLRKSAEANVIQQLFGTLSTSRRRRSLVATPIPPRRQGGCREVLLGPA
jgi:putative DNA methylase